MRRFLIAAACLVLAILLTVAVVGCASKQPFVASKNSGRFHKTSCAWAEQIHDKDRIGYDTREAALKDGKTACPTCNP